MVGRAVVGWGGPCNGRGSVGPAEVEWGFIMQWWG